MYSKLVLASALVAAASAASVSVTKDGVSKIKRSGGCGFCMHQVCLFVVVAAVGNDFQSWFVRSI
jgi:hypothetical protein